MAKNQSLKLYLSKIRQAFQSLRSNNGSVLHDDIARRAFVNNAFDGALTLLGILMGNIILGAVDARAVISTGLGACLAMGVSGSFGRYFSERAERRRALKQIEDYMFTDLSDSVIARESRKRVVMVSVIDGLSPAMAATIPLLPFFLVQASFFTISTAVVASFVLDFLVLFVLGLFLGKISGENTLLHGVLIVGVGFLTSIIILLGSLFLANVG